MFGASPHSHDMTTNSSTLPVNRRTWPKRCVSQPVSGTEMALATANDVMTHVPCDGLTPMSPDIAGIDTLAIDVSSTFMNVASDSAIVPIASAAPLRGTDAALAAAEEARAFSVEVATTVSGTLPTADCRGLARLFSALPARSFGPA